MNTFKRANNHLTHAQIVNEYEDKVRALKRENERLNAKNEKLQTKAEKVRYTIYNRIKSLEHVLEKEPNKTKQDQLEMLIDLQEEFK